MNELKEIWKAADEKAFTTLWVIATAAAVFFMAPDNMSAVAEIIVLKMLYVSVLLIVCVGTLYFLRGTACDIFKEIFEEHNTAAAVVVAALLLAIAIVIGK